MSTKKKSNPESIQGFCKWIIKCVLTQIGCLTRQNIVDHTPTNGSPFENVTDYVNRAGSEKCRQSAENKDRPKLRHDSFARGLSQQQICSSSDKKSRNKDSGAVMSFQNSTLVCADPGNGESYWVSFEEKSFSRGDDFKVYSGRMNGVGPKSGDKCVVKVFRRCEGTQNLCRCEVKKSEKAKSLARAFNNKMHTKNTRIKFTTLYWAQMDEVSKIKQLFFTGQRKLTTMESVLFEEDLRVNEEKPGRHRELTLFMDCQGKKKRCMAKDLEAFAHFTYHLSGGELVLCGLDGVQDEDGFYLKTPIIHSRKQEFGNSDNGLKGIVDVFSNHICNDFCKDMIKPLEELNSLSGQNVDNESVGKCFSTISYTTKKHDHTIPQVAACKIRPSLQRQDSIVSERSLNDDYPMLWMQGSESRITESMSGYLEPSAPMVEDDNDARFENTPPPYCSLNVANWILCEHIPNSFIAMAAPPATAQRLVNRVSVESGLAASEFTPSEKSSQLCTSRDLNANFSRADMDICEASASCYVGDCAESDITICAQRDRKRVRFSLSDSAFSSSVQSDTATSGNPTEISFVTSGIGGSQNPSHSNSAPSLESMGDSQDIPYGFFRLVNAGFGIPTSRYINGFSRELEAVPGPDHTQFILEQPPSYVDSEKATAQWIMNRGRASQNSTAISQQQQH